MELQVHPPASTHTLGRDLGPVGRLARVVAGLASLGLGGWLATEDGLTAVDVAAIGGYVVLIAGFYLAATAVLGRRLLARISPWTATTLFLTPVVVLALLPGVPNNLRAAIFIYYGVSLLLIAAIGYGGCEVVGIPMAVLRRRDVVYCPLNAIDAVERPLAQVPHRPTALVAGGLVAAAGVLLGVDEFAPDGGGWLPVDARWAAVLLLPAIVVLGRLAWLARADGESPSPGRRTGSVLGVVTLAAAAVITAVTGSVSLFFTAVLALMLVGGVVAALWRVAAAGRRRTASSATNHGPDAW
ncbi:MAG: hypothetical protein GEV12_13755 [Micromonosporaceae bacterium]|nr:hypothetical protein [Micromonosporaceae bacterium]